MKRIFFVLCLLPTLLHAQILRLGSLADPTPTGPILTVSPGTITGLNATSGTAGTTQTFSVTFANIVGNVTVTTFSPVEISKDGGSNWSGATVTFSTGSPVTITCRVAASASPGSISGNISASAASVTTQNVAVSGTVSGGGGTVNDTINVNLTDGQSTGTMHQTSWNNLTITANSGVNQTSSTLNYATGSASPSITATITQNAFSSGQYYDNTLAYATGNTSGYPDTAFRLPWGWFDDGPDSLIINNLPTAANNYTVIIGSSRNTTFARPQTIVCNGSSSTFDAQNNINTTLRFNSVVKDGSNRIVIKFTPSVSGQTSGNRASYLNFFTIIKNN